MSATTQAFVAADAWALSSQVGLRPEPFGALAYHFDTRRLVFLKSPLLVSLVRALADHPSAAEAIDAIVAPTTDTATRTYTRALASLAEAGVIQRRGPVSRAAHPDRPAAVDTHRENGVTV